jgi:ABC-2 type transport system permease protein
MTGYAVLLRKELLEQWRTMRLGIVVIVYAAFGLLSPATARYLPEILRSLVPADQMPLTLPTPTMADAIGQFSKNVGGTLTLAAILLAMGLIASERERGTAAFILTQRASRGAFVAAKLTALAVALGLAMAAAGATAYAYTAWLFEPPAVGPFAVMLVLMWLSQLSIGAITLFGSAIARSVVAAGAIGFAAYVVLAVVSALPVIDIVTPAGLQALASGLAGGEPAPDLWLAVIADLALTLGMGTLTWLSLRRQEL